MEPLNQGEIMPGSEMTWRFPPSSVALGSDEVHVWCAPLDQPEAVFRALLKTLDPDERQKAHQFGAAIHRERFVVGRGLLRLILSRYLGMPAERIEFSYNRSGKPSLKSDAPSPLGFNCAHSDKLILYAVAHNSSVGIDLEHIRSVEETALIAAHFFSPRENQELHALPPLQQLEAFFHGWTRKEAYMKAVGEEISESLHGVEVSLSPGHPTELLSIAGDPSAAAQWTLQTIIPAPGYIAALAIKARNVKLSCWQWPENPTSTLPISYRQVLSGQLN
jgi:4'-phosphopantetheinyl transferase